MATASGNCRSGVHLGNAWASTAGDNNFFISFRQFDEGANGFFSELLE
jgi:hypothetical protein